MAKTLGSFELPVREFKALSLKLTPYLKNDVWMISDSSTSSGVANHGKLISFDRKGISLFTYEQGTTKYGWFMIRHIFSQYFDKHLYEASVGYVAGFKMPIDSLN
jgi:hypothetical protein